MDTIFMNFENSKTLLNISDKRNIERSDKYVALSNLSIYHTWKKRKKSYKNNKFKISAPKSNEEFELPDGYLIFEYILKKMRESLIILQSGYT